MEEGRRGGEHRNVKASCVHRQLLGTVRSVYCRRAQRKEGRKEGKKGEKTGGRGVGVDGPPATPWMRRWEVTWSLDRNRPGATRPWALAFILGKCGVL